MAHLSTLVLDAAAQESDWRVPRPAATRARAVRISLRRLAQSAFGAAEARRFPRLKAESTGPRLTAAR